MYKRGVVMSGVVSLTMGNSGLCIRNINCNIVLGIHSQMSRCLKLVQILYIGLGSICLGKLDRKGKILFCSFRR